MANGVTSYNTVVGYLSSIKRLHELGSFPFPLTLHMLRLELRAIKKELAGQVKKATPVTPQLLHDIYSVIDTNSLLDLVAYYALIIGFVLFLRKSNLMPETQAGFKPGEQLTRADMIKQGDVFVCDIRWTKTNQYRKHDLLLPLVPVHNNIICPVFWTKFIMSRIPARPTDLFSPTQCWKVGAIDL